MKHFQLLAFFAVCIALAPVTSEPITTPYIPCKELQPLRTLNIQQLGGEWIIKKSYAVSEEASSLAQTIAKPSRQCISQEISQIRGPSLVLSTIDPQSPNNKNSTSCFVNVAQQGLWSCSLKGQDGFDVMVVMGEPNSFLLLASACVSGKYFPGMERYHPAKFAPVLWLFQKKDSTPLTSDKINVIDQRVQQILQRPPIQRDIDCLLSDRFNGDGKPLSNQDLNDFDNQDIGINRPTGNGFPNANNNGHLPVPGGNRSTNPHFGSQGGSTVLKPGNKPQTGVDYAQPGNSGALQNKKPHPPEVQKVIDSINNWFKNPINKKNNGHIDNSNNGDFNHNNGNRRPGSNNGNGDFTPNNGNRLPGHNNGNGDFDPNNGNRRPGSNNGNGDFDPNNGNRRPGHNNGNGDFDPNNGNRRPGSNNWNGDFNPNNGNRGPGSNNGNIGFPNNNNFNFRIGEGQEEKTEAPETDGAISEATAATPLVEATTIKATTRANNGRRF
ncbi:myb-like protein D [Cloeon dipterum]|uniref:myb-like protein D n=1 Tax=Cloeon dipterum TaxID=197152 RepID=UPI0032202314